MTFMTLTQPSNPSWRLKTLDIDIRVFNYLGPKLKYRKHNKRPLKLTYTIIKKGVNRKRKGLLKECELSYDQIRNSIDRLVENGIIEKHLAWDENMQRVLYLRLQRPIS